MAKVDTTLAGPSGKYVAMLPPPERITDNSPEARCTNARQQAVACYNSKNYVKAIAYYKEALDLVDQEKKGNTDSAKPDDAKTRSVLYSNMAQCYLCLEDWPAAVGAATQALDTDGRCVKALFRRSQAFEQLREYSRALEDAQRALQCSPGHPELEARHAALQKQIRENSYPAQARSLQGPKAAVGVLVRLAEEGRQRQGGVETSSAKCHSIFTAEECTAIGQAYGTLGSAAGARDWSLVQEGAVLVGSFFSGSVAGSEGKWTLNLEGSEKDIVGAMELLTGDDIEVTLRLHASLWGFLQRAAEIAVGVEERRNSDQDISDALFEAEVAAQKALYTTPAARSEAAKTRCNALAAVWPAGRVRSGIQLYVRGLTAISKAGKLLPSVEQLCCTCTHRAFEYLRLTGSLEDVACQKAFALGAEAGRVLVARSALRAVARMAEERRRLGSRVVALKCSSPLMRILHVAIAQLEAAEAERWREGVQSGPAAPTSPSETETKSVGETAPASLSIAAILHLLADTTDRPQEDREPIGDIFEQLLVAPGYLDPLEELEDTEALQRFCVGLQAIPFFWGADRSAVVEWLRGSQQASAYQQSVCVHALKPKGSPSRLQALALTVVVLWTEAPELRQSLLNSPSCLRSALQLINGKSAGDFVGFQLKAAVFCARLALHAADVRERLTREVNLCAVMDEKTTGPEGQVILRNTLPELMELFFFVTLHGDLKKKLLDNHLPLLTRIVESMDTVIRLERKDHGLNAKEKMTESSIPEGQGKERLLTGLTLFYYLHAVGNLLRSNATPETLPGVSAPSGSKSGPQLDGEQREALRQFFEQLPEHSRPLGAKANGVFDRGDPVLVEKFRPALLETKALSGLVQLCRPGGKDLPLSPSMLAATTEAIWLLGQDTACRGRLAAAGAVAALTNALTLLNPQRFPEPTIRCRQALAHICISVNPALLTYTDRLSVIGPLIALLQESYELYQYEGALAITNVLAESADARRSAFQMGVVSSLMDVATGENPLCRAAGLEGLCNLALCEQWRDAIAKGAHTVDIQILLAFLGEWENQRAQSAAAGCLAMLTADFRVAQKVAEASNVQNLRLVIEEHREECLSQAGLQTRLVTIYSNICTGADVMKECDVLVNLASALRKTVQCLPKERLHPDTLPLWGTLRIIQ